MKLRVILKTPDCLLTAVTEAATERVDRLLYAPGTPEDMREYLIKRGIESTYQDISEQWMPYGELLTVEFDTVARTAVVVPRSKTS